MLQKNDKVAIISPASQLSNSDRHYLDQAISLLESWSLQVALKHENTHHFYLAGTDQDRQRHLNEALQDNSIKAIFCVRGGYGASRLLQRLPPSSLVSPKMLIGFSDITSLHLAMAADYPQVTCIHGPNIATRQVLDSPYAEENKEALKRCLFEPLRMQQQLEFIRAGTAEGKLYGGCLSLINAAVGTPYLPDLTDAILLIEEVSEAPYKVDRMLQQLSNAGLIAQLNGIVFGQMHQCSDPYNDLKTVILDVLSGYDIPIAFGLKTGHGLINHAIPLGQTTALSSRDNSFHIK